jgi:hypothetical protein
MEEDQKQYPKGDQDQAVKDAESDKSLRNSGGKKVCFLRQVYKNGIDFFTSKFNPFEDTHF